MNERMKQRGPKIRQCALSKEEKEAKHLIRFVLSPNNEIVPDIDAKAEGRGVWISLSQLAVKEGAKKNIFSKSLSCQVKLPKDLAQEVRLRLEQRLLGALGLARKAGQLIIGGAKVRSAIEKGNVIALISASDGALDGRKKILNMANSRLNEKSYLHIDILHSDQLDLALGRENVIHGALIAGAAGEAAVNRGKRLIRYINN